MKADLPMLRPADFECMNVTLESAKENDSMQKLFVNKPVVIVYNTGKNID